jgi:hypothetical protein
MKRRPRQTRIKPQAAREPGYSTPATRANDPEADRMHFRRHSQLELEAFDWRARAARAEKLRREGDAFGALRELLGEGEGPGYTARELDRIGDLYTNMRTAPPGPVSYLLMPWVRDVLWQTLADGEPLPGEAFFVPDREAPMNHADALRNVVTLLERVGHPMKPKFALAKLREIDADREREGRERLHLPPPRKRLPRTTRR